MIKTLKFALVYKKKTGLKSFCCYNSHDVSLCCGRIYSLYVGATVWIIL